MGDDWWDRVPGGPGDRGETGDADNGADTGAGNSGDGEGGGQGNGQADDPARNEVVFELRGQTRVGRMTFEAATEIEYELKVGLNVVALRIAERDIRFTDIAAVIAATTRDPRRPVDIKEIREAVMDTGIKRLAGPVLSLLMAAFDGLDPHPPRGPAKIIDLAKYRAAKEPKDS